MQRDIVTSAGVEANLALASLYFYLGYCSGMRYSFNSLECLNPIPREEPEIMRSMIEMLPNEVAALRLGADPEPAALKINQLLSEKRLNSKRRRSPK